MGCPIFGGNQKIPRCNVILWTICSLKTLRLCGITQTSKHQGGGYTKMFKKLVYKIAAIKTEGDRNECFAEIDKAFDNNKITWNDHETLYNLAAAVVAAEN